MAREKKKVEPLLAHKHAFVDSLDNVVQQAITLHQVGKQLIELDLIKNPGIRDMFKERLAAFKAAIFTED